MYASPERRTWSLVRVACDLVGVLDERGVGLRVPSLVAVDERLQHRVDVLMVLRLGRVVFILVALAAGWHAQRWQRGRALVTHNACHGSW